MELKPVPTYTRFLPRWCFEKVSKSQDKNFNLVIASRDPEHQFYCENADMQIRVCEMYTGRALSFPKLSRDKQLNLKLNVSF